MQSLLSFFALSLFTVALGCSSSTAPPQDGGSPDRRDAAGDSGRSESQPPDGGIPRLTALEVTTWSGADVELVPSFSPSVFDYYVRCSAGANDLAVKATASRFAEALFVLPFPSASAPTQSSKLSVLEDQAIVAAASDGRATVQYWIRCLPHDFPHLQMTPHPAAGAPTPGYYLVGDFIPTPGTAAFAIVLDGNGVPIWYQRQLVGGTVCDVDDVIPGAISFSSEAPLGGGSITPFDIRHLRPPSTEYVTYDDLPTDGHDLRVLPNGDYLVFWAGPQPGVDLTGLTVPASDGGTHALGPGSTIYACNLLELDPSGALVWSWKATDHFDPAKVSTFVPEPIAVGGVPIVDVFHCNSVDVDPGGDLLVSARHMDSIFYIDKKSTKVVWKMGGPPDNKDGAIYVPVDEPFFRQHDARIEKGWNAACPVGKGQVSVFDDETLKTKPARGVLYDVNITPGDAGVTASCGTSAPGTTGATAVWQKSTTASVVAMGSFRILPDGERVIGWGSKTDVAFSEFDDAGHDVLDFAFTDGNSSYRAVKAPLEAFDLNTLRTTAGQ